MWSVRHIAFALPQLAGFFPFHFAKVKGGL
jgi:hypothetical protein